MEILQGFSLPCRDSPTDKRMGDLEGNEAWGKEAVQQQRHFPPWLKCDCSPQFDVFEHLVQLVTLFVKVLKLIS